MLVSLWNYFRGYVIVEVSGYGLERFINLAVTNGIKLEAVKRKENAVYMRTTIEGFKQLKPYAKKTKCRIKIVEKQGIPFIRFKYRRRWIFLVGSLLFAIGLYILSSFIWLVEITGLKVIDETSLNQYLRETGYSTGSFKHDLDLRELEKELIREYPEIVWVAAEYQGTKLLIQISEAVPKPEIQDETKPAHIIAKKDALITYIATEQGIPQVKVGDTVQKGDIIVSGSTHLEDEAQSLYLIHSKAEVEAKTCYSIKASIPINRVNKHYTNEVSTNYTFKILNWEIPFFHREPQYQYADQLITINQLRLTDQIVFPFYWIKEETVEYIPEFVARDLEETEEILLGEAHDKLLETIGEGAKVLKQEITYSKDDKNMYAVYNVIVEEDITEIKYLTEEMILESNTGIEGVSE